MMIWKDRDFFENRVLRVLIKQVKDELHVFCNGECVDVICIPPDEKPEETLRRYIQKYELGKEWEKCYILAMLLV